MKEDLDKMPDIGWDAEYKKAEKHQENSKHPGPKKAPRPNIPIGEYKAVCFKFEIAPYKNHGDKLYLYYQIMSGEYKETIIVQSINYNYDCFSLDTTFFTEWSMANGAIPKRPEKSRMTPRVFLDKTFLIKVRHAKPKYSDGTEKDEMFQYSVVARVIKVIK